MKRSQLGAITAVCLLLSACTAGLAPAFKHDIAAETDRLSDAKRQVEAAQTQVNKDLAGDPQLFADAAAPKQWKANLQSAAEQLNEASRADRALEDLSRRNRADSRPRAERLLAEERRERTTAVAQAKTVAAEADKWVAFKAALPAKLTDLSHKYSSLHERNISPVADIVHKAETDWPAKKSALESRLQSLQQIPSDAEKQWTASESARQHAAAGSATGADVATLIQADEALSMDASDWTTDADTLRALSGQLYDSWDKILTDLDTSNFENDRLFRERVKTVRTHHPDPASKETTTSASEQWVTVSEPAFRNVENNIGMAVGHKDVGLFDYEAQTTPQPAGFAYIASEQQGSNQYGYWGHDEGGSVWHWLPEYLILRELLWNHNYRPVVIDEYRGYQVARTAGRPYYGQATPTAPRTYGTGGTFTASHYAGSKYAQSGGFKGSAYASDRSGHGPSFDAAHPSTQGGSFAKSDGSGKRFGSGASAPSGQRFGQSHSFPKAGRGFGRHR